MSASRGLHLFGFCGERAPYCGRLMLSNTVCGAAHCTSGLGPLMCFSGAGARDGAMLCVWGGGGAVERACLPPV